jgi:hypothetical protein
MSGAASFVTTWRLLIGCCIILSMFLRPTPLAAQSLPAEEYDSLHKREIEVLRPTIFQALHRATNDIGRGFVLMNSIDAPRLNSIDRIVGRVDVQYERDGAVVESNFCTATAIGDLLVTASHCIPGTPPLKAVLARFTTKYYYDNQPLDDRFDIVLNDKNVHVTDLDFVTISVGRDVIKHTQPLFYRAPIQDETVLLVSHPLGKGKRLSVGQCKVQVVNPPPLNSNFVHTCATLEGSSGALLFGKSDGSILGMHVQGSGTAINIAEIVSQSPELAARVRPAPIVPESLDTTGWPLSEKDFFNYAAAALRSRSPATVFDSILNESTASDDGILGKSLYRFSVLTGSALALDYLSSRGIKLSPADRRAVVDDAIDAIDNGRADRNLLRRILSEGGEIAPDREGRYPECKWHSSEVVVVLREHKRKCTSE